MPEIRSGMRPAGLVIEHDTANGATARLRIRFVLFDREVVGVSIIRERRVADSETGADYRLLVETVCDSQPGCEILQMLFQTQIRGISADAGDHQRIVDGIELREPAGGLPEWQVGSIPSAIRYPGLAWESVPTCPAQT